VSFPKAVRKYLADRAEPETALLHDLDGSWRHVLAVPARRESSSFLRDVVPAARGAGGRVLVIVVVNGERGNREDTRLHAAFLSEVRSSCAAVRALDRGCSFAGDAGAFDVLAIDRATAGHELPPRRGVGLARKIATDVALALWADGRLASPWIHCSDGDAVPPEDRFALPDVADAPRVVAWTHPFRHDPSGSPGLDEAIRDYDEWLRYRVAGLAFARSPWAFSTIGSALTVRADALAAVRGFPPREAAEDFYLLAKLAKIGKVETAPTGPVRLRGRFSDRVPFGTGAGVARRVQAARRGEEPVLDDPIVFRLLALWQRAVDAADPIAAVEAAAASLPTAERRALTDALDALHVRSVFAALPAARRREWFDAFRTLRFLHLVRDAGFPPRPRREALERARLLGIDLSDLRDPWHDVPSRGVGTGAETSDGIQDR